MAIPSVIGDGGVQRGTNSILIASPLDEERKLRAQQSSQEGVRAGLKAATIAMVASAVPTLIAVRKVPWAKANLNYTAQALIISGGMFSFWYRYMHDQSHIVLPEFVC